MSANQPGTRPSFPVPCHRFPISSCPSWPAVCQEPIRLSVRLDGATRNLPDADLFLAMYVRQEALLSSQIEGTDCTLDDLLAFELNARTSVVPELDVQEVVNYVAALNYGMARLTDLPISR